MSKQIELRQEEYEQGSNVTYTVPVVADIRKEWDWVKQGIEELLTSSDKISFRPEDVYASCLTQKSYLWITHEGFVVTTTDVDFFTDEKIFFIWLAWAKNRGNDLAAKYQDFFANVSRETGHTMMETRSPHLAFMNYFTETLGWEIKHISYIKKV